MESASPIESFGDKLRALAFALALHLLCVLALLVGLWWNHETRPMIMSGPVIEAPRSARSCLLYTSDAADE